MEGLREEELNTFRMQGKLGWLRGGGEEGGEGKSWEGVETEFPVLCGKVDYFP